MDAVVAIVGAGPTGLTLANLLGAAGISTVLFERTREEDAVQFPRAVGMDHDALRTFQTIGLVERMLPDVIQNTAVRFFAADRSDLVHLRRAPAGSAETGWHRRNMFMQHQTDAVLREGLDRYDCVEVRYGTEVVALEQDDAAVTLTVRDVATGETGPFTASYVVGADGARSTVRKLLGLRLDGDTYEEPWLILEVDNDPWDAPWSSFFCDPARPIYSGHLPHGHRRWGLMLLEGETDEEVLSPAGLRRLLGPLVPSVDDLNIISARVYRHQARMVARMRVGRTMLVGDAAHLVPPWAGQGLNSGLRDATNLAWKIVAIERGAASLDLLETYDVERREHAKAVIALSRRFGQVFIPRTWWKVAVRDALLRSIKRVPGLRERFYRAWFTTPMRYGEGGVVVRPGGRQHPAVGSMFIQPEVRSSTGIQRLDDALGPWFAVLSFRCDPTEALGEEEQAFWKDLGARFVRVELSNSDLLDRAEPGSRVEDTYGALEQWFGRAGAQVVVVRPDRVVAAAGRTADFPAITRELAGLLDAPAPSAAATR